ncbi:hypothetical protein DDZ18_10110 [Marinicauda salina]|uniref:Beta-lactamase-related domain-containing protein n=1 Tax=Marinicauda salina TaxID=2135793 RepID=A0A2U2BSS7_9PROT|nr:serine hydrolase [Marinicauda salina]PWE17046.1 hypothetical protein DDZ18_10110 [Marinicauda salina]
MKTWILAAAASLASAPGWAQAEAPADDWTARAEAYVESAWPADGPGAAVIVARDGETVFAEGRGLADLETGEPITPDTVFRLGSITKQFSAAVILQLVEEGRLSLDDRVSDFLPDYPEPGASATVRQLLNHTSGVQSYTAIPGWMVEENTDQAYTTEELIAVFADLPAPSEPGEAWAYNNSGYVLVGAVIEAVTGQPWHAAVRERIGEPLGLETIRYGVGEDEVAAMAEGYTQGEDGPAPAARIHMSTPHAAGALIGTVGDLADWAHALHNGEVVSDALYAEMIAPTELPDGSTVPYGFGVAPSDLRGREAIGHAGGIFGFNSDSVYLPEEDLFVAVLANSDAPATPSGVAMRRLAAMALGDPYPDFVEADIDLAGIEPLFGVYAIEGGDATRRFYARDGQLYTLRSGASESAVFAAGDDRFFYGPDSLTWFEMERADDGAHVMKMHQNGAEAVERAVYTGPLPDEPAVIELPEATLARYVGEYALGQAVATVSLGEDGGLTTQLTGQPEVGMEAVGETEFRLQGVDARIVFVVEAGEVPAFVLHQSGREMRAERIDGE